MSNFWRRMNPKRAIEDFSNEWRQPTPHRWLILGVAVAATMAMLLVLLPPSERVPPPRPQVTYITTLAPDRTQAEIVASNLVNQQRKDKIAALIAQREEERKEAFRTLGRATFVDVDAMEERMNREEAAKAPPAARTRNGAAGTPGDR